MPNEQKKSRTLIEDLPVAEQEMTAEEMGNVQGGKKYAESRSNVTSAPPPAGALPKEPPTVTPKNQTPL